ncbi:molybdopterin biosynthesis protein [Candidatus Poribacteria bacterium]|nr:molybdopterin biosynthesis protein [Candidatus Poribacteria bacterium]
MERKRYLKKTSLNEALELFFQHPALSKLTECEEITTPEALGRITAEPVFAKISSPHYHCSAMDGVAVRAADTFGASEVTPIQLEGEQFFPLDTGDKIPDDYDAVIMIENVRKISEDKIEIISAATPWEHIRMVGEDVVATEMLLPRSHRVRPYDIAVLLSCGVLSIAVRRKPSVAIIPTGSELVDLMLPPVYGGADYEQKSPPPGKIIESNSHLIAGLVAQWDGQPHRMGIAIDDKDEIKKAILKGVAENDIVVINAGSSAGTEDYVPQMIAELGDLLVHGVDIMPGKPVSLGIIEEKPIIGVPGYPVSAYIVCELFLKRLIYKLLGLPAPQPNKIQAMMGRRTPSRLGSEEFVRVKMGRVNERLVAVPLSRGASLLNSVVRADGILRIPSTSEGIEQGEKVGVELLRPIEEIENNILIIGSHDIVLDMLADEIKISRPDITISSAHVGSLAGLTALKRGEAHIAGTHLLDETTGEYNISYIQRLFKKDEVALINLTYRQQGLIVQSGNPHGIQSLNDLAEKRLTYINRQRGSGTRILLDYQLKQLGIEPDDIIGYERELYTHLAVGAAVASGAADAGLGILSAARALNLDFVPIAEERYDLAIPTNFLQLPQLQVILELITQPHFRQRVEALGGYDMRDAGKRINPNSLEA